MKNQMTPTPLMNDVLIASLMYAGTIILTKHPHNYDKYSTTSEFIAIRI